MGCGRNDGGTVTLLDVGIMVKPEDLFDPKPYKHGKLDYRKPVQNFHTYDDSSADSKPLGFSKDAEIYLNDMDTYDCNATGCTDDNRVSVHTVNTFNRTYSMYRCGINTLNDSDNYLTT